MPRMIRVAAAQMGPVNTADSRQATIGRLISLLEQAANQSCQLVVFPELALTTFFPRTYRPDLAQADAFYETSMPSPDLEPLFDLARTRKTGFSLGFAELDRSRGAAGRYNTQILVDDEATIISKYRKIHLPGHMDFRPDDPFQNL